MRDQRDDRFQQGVQSDLDMLVLETMYRNTGGQRRLGGGQRKRATSGWKNRGIFFWIILALCTYWFFLPPLGL
jgi:hypothetical protein